MTLKKKPIIAIALIALLLLGACASKAIPTAAPVALPRQAALATDGKSAPAAAPEAYGYSQDSTANSTGSGSAATGAPEPRMLIRNGTLSLVVLDTTGAVDKIKSIVQGLQGYVTNSNTWHDGEQIRAQMTVRVPAESFDVAMEQLKAIATKVEKENSSGQDVTEAYTDLQSRLRTLQATEAELQKLLTQIRERTGKAEDILAVYRELTNIQSQIEQVKGRLQYYERLTDMSTINIELTPDALSKPIIVAGWRPGETVSEALRNLVKALQWFVDALIVIVLYIVPILMILAIPLVILILIVKRLGKRKPKKSS
jgi:hypothetical protein